MILDDLKTLYDYDFQGRQYFSQLSLNNYAMMFNAVQYPERDYWNAKMPQIVLGKFSDFVKSETKWFLLETSPRSGKTTLITDIIIPYLMGKMKECAILIVCGTKDLQEELMKKIKSNTSCLRGEKDMFFDNIFGRKNVLINNGSHLSFKYAGFRGEAKVIFKTALSTPPKGTGYNFVFFIDYMSSEHRDRPAMQRNYINNFVGFYSRKEHQPITKFIIDNQRLSMTDLSAHITSRNDSQNIPYIRLTMPYYFEEDTEYSADGNRFLFKKGDYLVSRFNEQDMNETRAAIGKIRFLTEYQQQPEMVRGEVFYRKNIGQYSTLPPITKVFMIADTAFGDDKRSDYNVYMVWAYDGKNLYLLDFFRRKLKGLDVNHYLYLFWEKWSKNEENLKAFSPKIQEFWFEENTHTKDLIMRMKTGLIIGKDKTATINNLRTMVRQGKGKNSRVRLAEPAFETGIIYLKTGGQYPSSLAQDLPNTYKNFNDLICHELESYRYDGTHNHDDIVDCIVDAINIVTKKYPQFNPNLH